MREGPQSEAQLAKGGGGGGGGGGGKQARKMGEGLQSEAHLAKGGGGGGGDRLFLPWSSHSECTIEEDT